MKTLLHTLKYFASLDGPDTQVSQAELDMVLRYAGGKQVIVEIGCYEGSTTKALASVTLGQVFTVDIFFPGRLGISYGELIARHYCRRLSNVMFLKGASAAVGGAFSQLVDLLFIDADHSYQGVVQDWKTWFPKVKPGGIIALHDCVQTPAMPGRKGSMEFYECDIKAMRDVKEIAAVDSLVVLRKLTAE